MNYNRLENSLIDVIKEEQAKLGYTFCRPCSVCAALTHWA